MQISRRTMRRAISVATLALGALALRAATPGEKLFRMTLPTAAGDSVSLRSVRDARATVFIFLEETCPICQGYTLTMRDLAERFTPAGIRFYGVFPNELSSPDSIASFKKAYRLPFTMLIDPGQVLTPLLGAHVTPEAIVVSPDGETLYKGRIDNLFYALGRRRSVITEHDLQDVLQNVADGKPVSPRTTKALGCYISAPSRDGASER